MFAPFDALGPAPEARVAPAAREEEWQAVAAALRPVQAALLRLAERELQAPAWRPGLALDQVAFAEGRRDLWRQILAAVRQEE